MLVVALVAVVVVACLGAFQVVQVVVVLVVPGQVPWHIALVRLPFAAGISLAGISVAH